MRAVVISQNRLVGLSLVALAEDSGLVALPASIEEVAYRRIPGDLALLYCDRWDDDAREVLAILRGRRLPVMVVASDPGEDARHEVLRAGALHIFGYGERADLQAELSNFTWQMRLHDREFTLANGAVVDLRRRRLLKGEHVLDLTPTEGHLLAVLRNAALQHPSTPVPTASIVHEVWRSVGGRAEGTLRSYVSQLRAKLEDDPRHPSVLLSRRDQGYYLRLQAPDLAGGRRTAPGPSPE